MPIRREWIQEGITDDAINWANQFGQQLTVPAGPRHALTTSQIRKFFGELKRIQADPLRYQDDIRMLKPKLAYAVGRVASKQGTNIVYTSKIKDFFDEIVPGLGYVRPGNKDDYTNFVKLVEAVVAYHKFHGGK
ncbi:MAG: type III-A CRISPR-associated protein Csm2 [Bacteroidetes bacterium]|nr:type III-A CRISPR-associated protein Csm2 [Bacteroidota bacterium]